eukprot:TRINITY_DN23768_c0_g2_i4.p1 TRINITY_DN23768_c0_g2~~TRINITY_DN23768_c0_g2_i4.p1  ORF type:complete len:474 (+),score=29.60 TRINITY_DN23768_c0_g2_i4:81-1502(+)
MMCKGLSALFLTVILISLSPKIHASNCQQHIDSFFSHCNNWNFISKFEQDLRQVGSCCWSQNCCEKLRTILDNDCFDDCNSRFAQNSTLMQVVGIHATACIPHYQIPSCFTDSDVFKTDCDFLAEDLLNNCGNNSDLVRQNETFDVYSTCCWGESCCQKSRDFLEVGCGCDVYSKKPFYHYAHGIARVWLQACGESSSFGGCGEDDILINQESGASFFPSIYAESTSTELVKVHSTLYRKGSGCQQEEIQNYLRQFEVCRVADLFNMQKMPAQYVETCCSTIQQLSSSACESCSSFYEDTIDGELANSLSIWLTSCPQVQSSKLDDSCSTQRILHFYTKNPLKFIHDLEINYNMDIFQAIQIIPMLSIFNRMLDVLNLKQLTGIQTIIAPTNSAFVATQKSTGLPLLEFINQQNNNKPIVEKEWLQIMQQHLIQQKIEVVSGLQYETVQGDQLEIKINNQKDQQTMLITLKQY